MFPPSRFILCLLAGCLWCSVIIGGRSRDAVSVSRTAVAVSTTTGSWVKLSGQIKHPGFYISPVNFMANDVINMAGGVDGQQEAGGTLESCGSAVAGKAIDVYVDGRNAIRCSEYEISTSERLLLGIPLDINTMGEDDFVFLDGIGPTIAQRIVEYRHKNGGHMGVRDLNNVEGIGEKRYKQLKNYF